MSHLLTVLNSSINFYIYLAKQGVAELRNLRLSIRDPEETEMVRRRYVKFENSLWLAAKCFHEFIPISFSKNI